MPDMVPRIRRASKVGTHSSCSSLFRTGREIEIVASPQAEAEAEAECQSRQCCLSWMSTGNTSGVPLPRKLG